MSKIKSALELAMERTSDLKVDRAAVKRNEISKKAAKAAALLLNPLEKNPDMKALLAEYGKEEQNWFRQAVMDVFKANISLPKFEEDLNKLDPLEQSLAEFTGKEKKVKQIFSRFREIGKQYLQTAEQMQENLRRQYEPQLRQKEQMLARQTGQQIQLQAEDDPQFHQYLQDQMGQLDQQFMQIMEDTRNEIQSLV